MNFKETSKTSKTSKTNKTKKDKKKENWVFKMLFGSPCACSTENETSCDGGEREIQEKAQENGQEETQKREQNSKNTASTSCCDADAKE